MGNSIPYLHYIHVILGKSTCFIGADYVSWAHGLTASESLYEVFLFQHLLYWEGQAESDSQGQALGYSDDDESYC